MISVRPTSTKDELTFTTLPHLVKTSQDDKDDRMRMRRIDADAGKVGF